MILDNLSRPIVWFAASALVWAGLYLAIVTL